jgi:GNAT superfamily N-acetyltransferase
MNVTLRELSRKDLPQLNKWRNNPDLVKYLGSGFNYIDEEIDHKWYDNYLANREKSIRLSIELDGKYVGNVNLTNINLVHRNAEYSIMIGSESSRGLGVGFHASSQIIEHGFQHLGLHRIWLTVLESNLRALSLYQKLGFQIEGRMRDSLFKNGDYQDLIVMALINT